MSKRSSRAPDTGRDSQPERSYSPSQTGTSQHRSGVNINSKKPLELNEHGKSVKINESMPHSTMEVIRS
jgi:hypothetical protein